MFKRLTEQKSFFLLNNSFGKNAGDSRKRANAGIRKGSKGFKCFEVILNQFVCLDKKLNFLVLSSDKYLVSKVIS